MDSYGLYSLALNYLDLLFRQPVKLVDRGVYLALEERSAFILQTPLGLGESCIGFGNGSTEQLSAVDGPPPICSWQHLQSGAIRSLTAA